VTKPKRPLGLSIEERPKSIDERSEYGHWEIDTVLLTKEKGECLLILSERKSRIEIIRLIPFYNFRQRQRVFSTFRSC